MPQMSPINWLTLFFIMSLTLIMFNMLNYFMNMYMMKNNMNLMKNKKVNNWKW